MAVAIPTVPGEQTPLLYGNGISVAEGISESDSEVANLAEPVNRGSQTPSIKGKANGNGVSRANKKTPLPWAQFSIVLFLQLAEPLTSQVISPFEPEMIRSLNIAKNDAEVGFYVGVIQSLFFATQACTVLYWSRLSDHIGRKPVVLTGLFGLSLSMYCIGLSKTFWGLVLSRSLNGALNGNIGVIKTMTAEMSDLTNLSLAFSYQPIAWSSGATIGPIIGGALSRPAERFPKLFGNNMFLKGYPYFLPCAVTGTCTIVAWLVSFFFLKETHPSRKSLREFICGNRKPVASEEDPLLTVAIQHQNELEEPLPLRDLLTRNVVVASVNYAFLALVDISFHTLQPVFLATPIELGGLGLDPPMIGTVLSSFGILNALAFVFFFSPLTDYFGAKKVYMAGMFATVPCFALFPVITYLARKSVEQGGGLGTGVWVAVGIQVVLSVIFFLGYGAVFIFITGAAPNKASLGATNGFAQLLVSIVRAIGPALVTTTYSLSIDEEHHYLNGGLVHYLTIFLSFGVIWMGSLLPRRPFKDLE